MNGMGMVIRSVCRSTDHEAICALRSELGVQYESKTVGHGSISLNSLNLCRRCWQQTMTVRFNTHHQSNLHVQNSKSGALET